MSLEGKKALRPLPPEACSCVCLIRVMTEPVLCRFTSWDIARISYGGAQGLSHSLVSAKRVSGQPKGYQTPGPCDGVENQPVVGTAGAGDAGAGVKRPASSSANQEFLVARGPFAGAAGGGKFRFSSDRVRASHPSGALIPEGAPVRRGSFYVSFAGFRSLYVWKAVRGLSCT